MGIRLFMIRELFSEYSRIIKHFGTSGDLYQNQDKLKARIVMNAHSIEKGLSLKNIKLGYGKSKILMVMRDLECYYKNFNDKELVLFYLSIVEAYLEYNKSKNVEDQDILDAYMKMKQVLDSDTKHLDHLIGGYFKTSRDKIHLYGKIDYYNFVRNRHSIRNFTGNQIDIALVNKALEIAQYTPSACNRQPWGNHVFIDKEKINQILDFQTGARQFKEDITCVIMVTSKYSSFFGGEYHQPYVNGGMYAMNLIFALHSLGLGTTPLNMGFSSQKLKVLKNICDIKDDEVPIVLIGVGEISEELSIATSSRFKFKEYTKYY
ncbi:nitroreductase family protein [Capnocytophaga canis]|uniref:nitroreductase family protein n=1 Tax=Capnocytophaga canis TaxID=1848903 RepID=UPI00370D422D